ncbi:MAG: 3-keto-5-aminohexanoate cleavage protein [Hyphomicrobiaceae bacterium]
MAKSNKVIITCAVTGSIHTPTMSEHLPITAEEIADAAIGAAEAGAAIVHLHARNPKTGQPDQSMEAFAPFLKVIKQRSPAVINITTGGAMTMSVEERARPATEFKPEVASLNMGTMNFGLYPMLDRFSEFKHDWERPYLENSRKGFFKNTFADIEYILTECAENGTRFEIECYDIGHLYTLAHMADRQLIKPPFFVQSVFGILGGIGTHAEDVAHMKRTADRLFGGDYQWSVLAAGRHQMRIAAIAAAMGGNIRVGMEDSLWAGPGRLAQNNAEQVKMARQIIEGLGREIATADEARELLHLKGGDRVNF